jgi:hypothetical protein
VACPVHRSIVVATSKHGLYFLLGIFVVAALAIFAWELTSRRALVAESEAAAMPGTPGEFRFLFMFNPVKGLTGSSTDIHVKPPPLSGGYWPCSECHNPKKLKDNPEKRVLVKDHANIELHHDEENRWCLDCHDFKDRDHLHLVNGTLIGFEESHRLCGQCHGTIYRDWKAGVHGQRTGYWNGAKRYLLCVNCHWPHSPRFAAVEPLPPPVRPEFIGLGLYQAKKGGRELPEEAKPADDDVKAEGAKE